MLLSAVSPAQQFAKRLKIYRNNRKWDRSQLADKAGVARQQVEAWENCRYLPSLLSFIALARALDLTLDELWGATSPPEI